MSQKGRKEASKPAKRAKGPAAGDSRLIMGLGAVAALLLALVLYSKLPARAQQDQVCRPGDTRGSCKASDESRNLHLEVKKEREIVSILPDGRKRTTHPSFGLFPRGCKWRVITTEGENFAGYEFWDGQGWTSERPGACGPEGFPKPGPPGWEFNRGSPRSEVTCEQSHCMYTNLYYNNGRWYALVDGPDHIPHWRFSRNQEIVTMHVDKAQNFLDSVKWNVIPGDTILFDFIFFIHPTAIGHWWEMLGPLYSILKKANFKRPCDQFILLHLQRQHVLEWVRAMVAVALGTGLKDELPSIYVQEETDNAWTQITQQLEGLQRDRWYIFERVLMTRDLYTGGGRTFLHRDDAREFRSLIYQQYGLPPPAPRAKIPHTITWQRKSANRRVLNEDELVKLLRSYGDLRIVEFNSSSSLYEQLMVMRDTGVYISVHTSNLANAPLLQPGSAVFEVLQRNWHWNGLDTSFRDQTAMMGDIHHYAWRAQRLNETVYLVPRDLEKVAFWPPEECGTEECVEAHTRVDVYVDIPQFKQLLDSRLPFVWRGASTHEAQVPWPPARDY